jgi:hypothetical protein
VKAIKNKTFLGMAALSLLISALGFTERNSPYGGTYHHYSWLLWAIFAAVWLYRSFKPEEVSTGKDK